MYVSIGNKGKGRGIELSGLGEWADDSYVANELAGIDIMIKAGIPLHLAALRVADNHVALCVLNVQIVFFWKN